MSFDNVFDSGGSEADSAEKSADALKKNTPGADQKAPGAKGVPKNVHDLERERDPWLVRQTAHGALDVMGFLGPMFQKFKEASAAQKDVAQKPQSTSDMASSAKDKAFEKVQVRIRDEDLPNLGDEEQKRLKEAHERSKGSLVVTDELGQAEGLAVDPSRNKAYIADRTGKRLWEVDLTSGSKRVAAGSLGSTPNDVTLDGTGTVAYVADWDGDRLLKVNLPHGDRTEVAVVDGQYGVALDTTGKIYVADGSGGHLNEVNLQAQQTQQPPAGVKVTKEPVPHASGVALDGHGKAYIGQWDGENLYEVDLADSEHRGEHRVVATLPGAHTVRVELDGAGNAYVADRKRGRLYKINLADGAYRPVATGLGKPNGLALDTRNGHIYVCNQEGQLWRISHVLPKATPKP